MLVDQIEGIPLSISSLISNKSIIGARGYNKVLYPQFISCIYSVHPFREFCVDGFMSHTHFFHKYTHFIITFFNINVSRHTQTSTITDHRCIRFSGSFVRVLECVS